MDDGRGASVASLAPKSYVRSRRAAWITEQPVSDSAEADRPSDFEIWA
jgi:hypothetical protein